MAAQSPAALIGPCLEKIHHAASGRKYNKLRQDAKALLEKLDTLTKLQPGPRSPLAAQRPEAAAAGTEPSYEAQQEQPPLAAVVSAESVSSPIKEPVGEAASGLGSPEATAVSVGYGEPSPVLSEGASSDGVEGAAAGSHGASAASEQVELHLEEGVDGEVQFRLKLSPSKAAGQAVPETGAAQPEVQGPAAGADSSAGDPGHARVPAAEGAIAMSPSLPVPPRQARPAEAPARPGALLNGNAKELLAFLNDAIATRRPPVMELSLDLIQKLISFKLLQGPVYSINHRRDISAKPGKKGDDEDVGTIVDFELLPPQAQALELICRCDDVSDEAVELRLLKALLTAVTSSTLSVHGQALLLVVRACYNVFLTSRVDVNQATAKATLTQMLNVVFQRMEAGSVHVVVPPIMVQDVLGLPAAETSNMSAFVQQFLHDVATTVDPWGTVAEGIQQGLDDAFQQTPKEEEHELDDYLDPSDPSDRQQIEWRQGGGESPQQPAGSAQTNGTAARSPGPTSPDTAGGPSPAQGGEGIELSTALSETTSAWGSHEPQLTVASQLQKDAFLVFRALCKLSIRSDTAPGSELTTIRGKVLALQLLKVLLGNSGQVFQNTERFITAIKQYLCLSLLKNCASQIPQAQRLCCSIFLTLMTTFRKNLKAEIGVFFPMIMLRPIEPAAAGTMPNAPAAAGTVAVDIAHKTVVLQCVQQMCENGQLLVDLFVNYDCDLEGANLFERMITALVRIAQGSLANDTTIQNPLEEQVLRFESLRCLVLALRSMTLWYNATVISAAGAALPQAPAPVASDDQQQQGTPAPVAELAVADENMKNTWMETLASGRVDDRPPGVATPPGAGMTPSVSEAGLASMGSDQRQVQMVESWKAFKRVFQEGVALFNQKPKKGIAYLQEQKLVGSSPAEVAQFLEKTQGLNKTQIGDYLGEREDFSLKVMHAYVDAMDFTELEFDEAIRKFLSGFRLPGEAQKIDRLMEKFAARYVTCNPDSFKSADVGYVLAYSVILLNTDAHNPTVKKKMSKQDFLRNNRGINDGGDLPVDFLEALYDRIINNEIKMQDDPIGAVGQPEQQAAQAAASAGWLDTIMGVLGRQKPTTNEPNEESIRRTHDYLREKAKGVTFFEARDGEAVRPMLDVAWAPMLGAFSVLFEEKDDEHFTGLCLNGIAQAVRLTCLLNMVMLRNTFVSSLARFTMLHSPTAMRLKSAWAFRALLKVADQNGNSLQDCWSEVLRCVSRFELLQQATAGVPTDALLFAMPPEKESAASRLKHKLVRQKGAPDGEAKDSFSSINDMGLHSIHRSGSSKDSGLPPPDVMRSVDPQEINRLFINSAKLDSEAIVHFVRTLSSIAQEELKPVHSPRVFSLTKIVEISHFNMGRIRLVWNRIWAVLSDFFIEVGCHRNLQVAMYGVDSLRQLAMKFLERDELANYTFQNDFLRPFVVIMRHSRAVEIRELIIRCVSQMVLARVANVKSGWKTMFMVFTTAAIDESPQIVRLAFDTIEKIVREYFHYITEVETTTFTDCVNCLIAYTNNPHSLDVSLNAIAFLRFCAMKLAEGDIGDVEELPEGTGALPNPNTFRIRPRGQDVISTPSRDNSKEEEGEAAAQGDAPIAPIGNTRIKFTDKDEHMYFWFPLLAGLSELTFDPRPEIRYSSLEVLFDILKFHGASFTPQFWTRVFDSVLLPIFDHVRAEVTDTTTFTDEKRRAEVDAWLYETCTRTLQHIVEIVVQYYPSVFSLLDRILELLLGFVRRTHQSLAAVGVAAMSRLILAAGAQMDEPTWMVVMRAFSTAVGDTLPNVPDLIQHRMARRTVSNESGASAEVQAGDFGIQSPSVLRTRSGSPTGLGEERRPMWSLGEGAGARRLAEVKVRAAIQLLVVQSCGEVYAKNARYMPPAAAVMLLDVLRSIATHAGSIDADIGMRHSLLMAQAADKVPAERCLPDPPLLRLEAEASQAYLSTLLHILAAAPESTRDACSVEARLVQLCMRNLERFEGQEMAAESREGTAANGVATSHQEENAALAPLVVATLRAMLSFSPQAFKTHLKDFFPLLTNLISCEYAPLEVQKALSDLFSQRIGPMLG